MWRSSHRDFVVRQGCTKDTRQKVDGSKHRLRDVQIIYCILHRINSNSEGILDDESRNFGNSISVLFPLLFQFKQVIYAVRDRLKRS
jgi:hypothetical protein